jgi:uncharacterized protein DUF3140
MTPKELHQWLKTDESRRVGQKPSEGAESVGHHSGRRIADLLSTKKADLSDSDYEHLRKVVGYVHRHSKQRPAGDVSETDWRYSLMNWGHDPTK